jgi:hypothetical protein
VDRAVTAQAAPVEARRAKTIRRSAERVEPVVRALSQAPVAAAVEAERRAAQGALVLAALLEAERPRPHKS